MQVSHLHQKQQRLVAHHVLIDANELDGVEAVRILDHVLRLPSARTAALAVFHDTPKPSATLATLRC